MVKHILAFCFVLCCATFATTAQTTNTLPKSTQGLTPEQLKQLQNLSPKQIEDLKKKQEEMLLKEQQMNANNPLGKNKPLLPKNDPALQRVQDDEFNIIRDTTLLSTTYEEYFKQRLKEREDSSKVFGRNIFSKRNLTFAPSMNLPTPLGYILASGDELNINIWGAAQENYKVVVSPDGYINMPNVGLMQLSGQSIRSAEQTIKSRLIQTVEGLTDGSVFINISLGNIRSIKINIVGEASVPGTYTLPSLATLFNAMYVAGGVSDIGSLRNIKLFRRGKQVASLDVYQYLLNGKQEVNMRLEDDDQILIEPYANLVTLTGKVKRPMIYEMLSSESVQEVINYAGGFSGEAYTENVSLSRRSGGRQFQQYTVDKTHFGEFHLMDKDSIDVGMVIPTYANRVKITGAVWREGDFELSPKISTVSQLLEAAEGVQDDAFLGRAQLIRIKADRTREVLPINLARLMRGEVADVPLVKDDSLSVVSINDLREQRTVSVYGEVNDTLTMPYIENMTLDDIIVMAKGLKESASTARVEVARRIKDPASTVPSEERSKLFTFAISESLNLTPESQNFKLEPFDQVYVRSSPGYSKQQEVTISGEVLFAGKYVMGNTAEKLSILVTKAGGVTPEAYVEGSFLRRQITEYDMERERSRNKMMRVAKTIGDTMMVDKVEVGDYHTVGINLKDALQNPNGTNNIVLQEGDILVIPVYNNTVTINGAVYYPNTVTYIPGKKIRDYIDMAGGYSHTARKQPVLIYQNGMVASTRRGNPPIAPGCEIVVPQKQNRRQMGASEWMNLGTSAISMMAMITSLFR